MSNPHGFLHVWTGLVATADPHTGMFKELSRGWERILGWSREELLAKPFVEFVHPDDRAATVAASMNLGEGGEVVRFVNRYACKDGSYKSISWTSSVDPNVPPAERVIHASAHDISEHVETQRELERALGESESFRGLAEATSDFIGMASLDGRVEYMNKAGLEMVGLAAEEIFGQPLSKLLPPGYLARVLEEAMPHAIEQGIWSGEGELLRRDGELVPISQVIVRLSDRSGGMRLGTIIRDVSEAKRLEAELRAQRDRLREALQAMSTPIIPITGDIVVMPLIGQMDTRRAERVMAAALDGVQSSAARVVILDVTGLTALDSMVATSLVSTARALRLLGAQTILTGIQPAVAQTLVALGLDLGDTTMHGTLQAAIASALSAMAGSS